MLRPAHAEGGQLDGGGFDGADGPRPEPVRESGVVPAGGQELGILFLERFIDLPEQFLGHVRGAGLVGVREAIAAWRSTVAELPSECRHGWKGFRRCRSGSARGPDGHRPWK